MNYELYLDLASQRQECVTRYSKENLKPLYLSLVRSGKIEFGDRNEITSEGIVTSSRELYEKYLGLPKGD